MELKLVLKGRVDSAMGTGEGEQKDNLTNSRLSRICTLYCHVNIGPSC